MIRRAFYMKVRPGMLEEYRRAHNPIPEELARTLKEHGISNYSIFHHPGTDVLCGYLEISDPETLKHLADHACCREWWNAMCVCLETDSPGAVKAREEEMTEVFHLD